MSSQLGQLANQGALWCQHSQLANQGALWCQHSQLTNQERGQVGSEFKSQEVEVRANQLVPCWQEGTNQLVTWAKFEFKLRRGTETKPSSSSVIPQTQTEGDLRRRL